MDQQLLSRRDGARADAVEVGTPVILKRHVNISACGVCCRIGSLLFTEIGVVGRHDQIRRNRARIGNVKAGTIGTGRVCWVACEIAHSKIDLTGTIGGGKTELGVRHMQFAARGIEGQELNACFATGGRSQPQLDAEDGRYSGVQIWESALMLLKTNVN